MHEYDVTLDRIGSWSPFRARDCRTCGVVCFLHIFALLSERCNSVKMIATKIFVKTIFVENLMQNIFGDLMFSPKMHISREKRENVISGSRFDSFYKRDRVGGRGLLFSNTLGHA